MSFKLKVFTTREIDITYACQFDSLADLVDLLKDVGMDFDEFLADVDDSNIKTALLNLDDKMERWVKEELMLKLQELDCIVDEETADENVSSLDLNFDDDADVSVETINKALMGNVLPFKKPE